MMLSVGNQSIHYSIIPYQRIEFINGKFKNLISLLKTRIQLNFTKFIMENQKCQANTQKECLLEITHLCQNQNCRILLCCKHAEQHSRKQKGKHQCIDLKLYQVKTKQMLNIELIKKMKNSIEEHKKEMLSYFQKQLDVHFSNFIDDICSVEELFLNSLHYQQRLNLVNLHFQNFGKIIPEILQQAELKCRGKQLRTIKSEIQNQQWNKLQSKGIQQIRKFFEEEKDVTIKFKDLSQFLKQKKEYQFETQQGQMNDQKKEGKVFNFYKSRERNERQFKNSNQIIGNVQSWINNLNIYKK